MLLFVDREGKSFDCELLIIKTQPTVNCNFTADLNMNIFIVMQASMSSKT